MEPCAYENARGCPEGHNDISLLGTVHFHISQEMEENNSNAGGEPQGGPISREAGCDIVSTHVEEFSQIVQDAAVMAVVVVR